MHKMGPDLFILRPRFLMMKNDDDSKRFMRGTHTSRAGGSGIYYVGAEKFGITLHFGHSAESVSHQPKY